MDLRTWLITGLAKPPPLAADRPSIRPDLFGDAGMVLLRTSQGETPRSGAASTPDRTVSSPSPPTPTPMRCRSRFATTVWRCWPTRHVHLPRRARMAVLLPLHTSPQHAGTRGLDQSVSVGPSSGRRRHPSRQVRRDERRCQPRGLQPARTGAAPPPHRGTDRARALVIEDEISGGESRVRLSFHLGPEVEGRLNGKVAELTWPGGSAVMTLPEQLVWSCIRGGVEPIDGWYSPHSGSVPTTSFAGIGNLPARVRMRTEMDFTPTAWRWRRPGGPARPVRYDDHSKGEQQHGGVWIEHPSGGGATSCSVEPPTGGEVRVRPSTRSWRPWTNTAPSTGCRSCPR